MLMSAVGAGATILGPTGGQGIVSEEPPRFIRPDCFESPWLGFALNVHHVGDLELYLQSVDRIAEVGSNTLVVLSPMFMRDIYATDIHFIQTMCATDDQLVAILRRAKAKGLRTILMPVVLIERPKPKEWRGVIKPTDWDRWWRSYEGFLDRFVRIANEASVDVLCVGSELNSAEPQTERWERVIGRTRRQFQGMLSYSSNWDRFAQLKFWDDLDLVCVSSYFELIDDVEEDPSRRGAPPPTREELAATWRSARDLIVTFARKLEKPVILSEVGYPSLPWAAEHPWNYIAPPGTQADHEAQARCWGAFFDAWTPLLCKREPHVAGVMCYHWDPYHRGEAKDIGYGVEGKPALAIIRQAFEAVMVSTTPATTQPEGDRAAVGE
jgi:hypothetical protein